MKYYHDKKKVWEFEDGIDLKDFPQFAKLTTEQKAFYLQCKNESYRCTIDEILNAKKTIIEIDIIQYRKSKILELRLVMEAAIYNKYDNSDLVFALYGIFGAAKIDKIKLVVENANIEFQRVKSLINDASTLGSIDEAFTKANFQNI